MGGRSSCRPASSRSCAYSPRAPGGWSPGGGCSTRSGGPSSTATSAPSTSTSGCCARRSSPIRTGRSTSAPYGGSATVSRRPRMLRSLGAKLILTYAGLTLLTVGALAIFTVTSLETLLLRQLADDLGAQANLVSEAISENLASGRLDQVRDQLANMDAETNARILVVDIRRRVVGATEAEDRARLGTPRDDLGLREALRGEVTRTVLPRTSSGEVLYVVTPVRSGGQIVGAVRLAYRLEDVEETIRSLNLTVAAGAMAVVLL